MAFHNYDPGRVVATWKGIALLGFMEGTFLSVEREEDAFEKLVGAGGDVVRVRNRNRSGTATFTLLQSSPTNDQLSAEALQDELFGTGYGPLLIKDLNGTTLVSADSAWIQKLPTIEFADTATGREWVIACAEMIINVGGAVV